jgi:hypothetical protein
MKVFIDKDTGEEFEGEKTKVGNFYIVDASEPKRHRSTRYRICMWVEDNPEDEVFEQFVDATQLEAESIANAVSAIVESTGREVSDEPTPRVDPYVALARKLIESNKKVKY